MKRVLWTLACAAAFAACQPTTYGQAVQAEKRAEQAQKADAGTAPLGVGGSGPSR
jgi:hypothetical protein